ncbi:MULTISPECIES: methylamine dehydrogenase accessory protein MauD [unclassified Sphingobium]|uniref:methylamine dehydrogenase accessory protein MauD n=1 Tax=unclassified Sphingobium TaxID=2611147 RepID=UPI000D15D6BC|nr:MULTISPECIES: methylamine dehydrogenase accessory protein MauD [unclassified Sphingobium]MBG6120443.1 methylamine dehydrogenase accessory protein MauD [Sphingobium sp. JAI105]PSO10039.1 methylamine dehydrogenase accessory protein MauD [Sphingobium sp. AEW4]TWC98935.1 methylamine dehydrogenase accessory protein MauD [Sphingobium sp. AEW010]TWD18414.1 methylamine dehydrogenase accessory protein MauD [Sphingobium sp. AEW013]TWD21042.1 methylamine dehydrogenase accessory protein MauD [Sphingobi
MITTLSVALALLWLLVLGLAVAVLVLLRQVGLLHERLGPVGALTLTGGPKAGDPSPRFDLEAIDGRSVSIGHHTPGQSTLLFFLSPTCPVCKTLLPILKSIAREQGSRLRVILASDGEPEKQRAMVSSERLSDYPLLLSTPLGLAFEVSKLPHAVLIDSHGIVVAKGLVNNREHFESLFEAQASGIASIQDYNTRRLAPELT